MNNEPLSPTSRVRRRPDVLFTPINDEVLALDETSGHCYSLNEVAGQLWQWIETPRPIDELCARLQEEYEVDPERCVQEVQAVLEGLRKVGLVEVEADAL
jgi:PqqD family protein of HPr-rel-A system